MSKPRTLVRTRPKVSLLDFSREQVLAYLREKLAGRGVVAAYLFGSFAEGTHGAWSDLDVVIVKPTREHPVERPREFHDLTDLGVPVDVLVYTPEEFKRLELEPTGFWKEFARTRVAVLEAATGGR
ncbi:MAG: hypothetical protein Kow0092_37440 [Deferrisomatales bacterium]